MDSISLDYSFNMKSVIRYRDMMGAVPFKDWLRYPVCASLTCRGCTHDCITCGGSATAFREHFGRDKVAFSDPALLVKDIAHIQKYIPGPMFVLNDFLQAGPDYTRQFVEGLKTINMKNPIGFEFFKPPASGFYEFLNENLNDYSVEISVESHDDGVRAAFGKKSYTMEQVEKTVVDALANGCSRFDLYFMTGIPTQTASLGPRDHGVREAPLRGRRKRQAPPVLHEPHGALPRPGFDRIREPRGARLHAASQDARGAPPAPGAAVVEAHHELREPLDEPRRDVRSHLRRRYRYQQGQGRRRHHRSR